MARARVRYEEKETVRIDSRGYSLYNYEFHWESGEKVGFYFFEDLVRYVGEQNFESLRDYRVWKDLYDLLVDATNNCSALAMKEGHSIYTHSGTCLKHWNAR